MIESAICIVLFGLAVAGFGAYLGGKVQYKIKKGRGKWN